MKAVRLQSIAVWFALVVIAVFTATSTSAATVATYGPFNVAFYNVSDGGAANWTPTQMADVGASIATWDAGLVNVQGRQINMIAIWSELDPYGTNILGGSYSPSNGNGTTAWTYPEHVWRDGVNYDGRWDAFDTAIQYDVTAAGYSWNFGSGAPSGSQIDFRSVITHEIGHSLGFYDTYDPSYDDWGNAWGTETNPYAWAGYRGLTEWDQNLVDASGNLPTSGGYGAPGNFNELSDPLYWTGTNANTLYGAAVPIYAPTSFQPGSSLAHVDYGAGLTDALMNPAIYLGAVHRDPLAVEWQMMKDMGWLLDEGVPEVPEPSTLVIFLSGMACLAVFRRNRRSD